MDIFSMEYYSALKKEWAMSMWIDMERSTEYFVDCKEQFENDTL